MKVFLSYDRDDTKLADHVVAGLESEGFEVWVDRESIIDGDSWRRQIVSAVDDCDAILKLVWMTCRAHCGWKTLRKAGHTAISFP